MSFWSKKHEALFDEGKTDKEIAAITGRTPGAVSVKRSALKRAPKAAAKPVGQTPLVKPKANKRKVEYIHPDGGKITVFPLNVNIVLDDPDVFTMELGSNATLLLNTKAYKGAHAITDGKELKITLKAR